jgi:hypothetical protein
VAAAIPRVLIELDGHTGSIDGAAFFPDGRRIVTASRDGTARVWDVTTGGTLSILGGPDKSATRAVLSLSHDGRRIVTAGGATARVWDAASRWALAVLRATGVVKSASFSPDDRDPHDQRRRQSTRVECRDGRVVGHRRLERRGHPGSFANRRSVVSAGDGGVQIWEPGRTAFT